MKLQLDITAKTVQIDESVNIGELVEALEKMLPDIWRKFSIEVVKQIEWKSPIVIKEYYPTYPYPHWVNPWYNPITLPTVYMNSGDVVPAQYELAGGTYCVEI